MSPAATVTRQSLKDRLQDILAMAMTGVDSEDHCDGGCGSDLCAQLDADSGTLDAAFRAIERAPDEAAMLAIYTECWLALAGIPAPEWSVAVIGDGSA
jgi:hypothetical protein